MLVNETLPALYNGVSQQPPILRLPSQGELQINAYPTVVDGQRKRPPSEHVARLTTEDLTSAFLHEIDRDPTERYVVVLTSGAVRVFDMLGGEKTVVAPNGYSYLTTSDAKSAFVCTTVADYTFVLNKNVTVSMEATAADQTPQSVDRWWLNRQYIGDEAYGAAVQRQYAANPAGGFFKGTVQSFAKLPEAPSEGDIYKIAGTDDSNFATYYVRRTGGAWQETVAPGIRNRIDATTMPHALVRKADGTFEFGPFSWNDRKVGDETTNPNPSFVGRSIQDIFFEQNRLGLAVDEGAVMSRVGDFGNYYRLTVVSLLADEVVDIAASETKVTKIRFAVPFSNTMMFFSDQVQFRIIEKDAVVGPTTLGIKVATQFKMNTRVRPLPQGSDVYFVVEQGDYSQIREYYVEPNSIATDAGDISAHVPKYIPKDVTKLSGSETHGVLFASSDQQPARLYHYNYFWADENTKAQTSWGYWQFDSDVAILSHTVLDNYVYIVARHASSGTFLERIPLESGAVAQGLSFQVYLDRRAVVTGTFLPESGKTEFALPYLVDTAVRSTFRIVRGSGFVGQAGAIISVDPANYQWIDENHVQVVGNFSASSCFIGKTYEHRYRFSQQFPRNSKGEPIVTGRLMLRTWTVTFEDAAYFRVEVAPYGADADITEVIPDKLSEFSGKTLGAANLILGAPVFSKGSFTFGVQGDARVATVDFVNDTPYSATLIAAEYEGFWHQRAR
jgi:hypothetical protein